MSITFKVGNKIQRSGGMICTIEAVADKQIAVRGSDGRLYLINDYSWPHYSDFQEFFELGKKYVFKGGMKPYRDTYKIVDLYQVDNPLYKDHGLAAVARVTDGPTGREYVTVLNISDFRLMKAI